MDEGRVDDQLAELAVVDNDSGQEKFDWFIEQIKTSDHVSDFVKQKQLIVLHESVTVSQLIGFLHLKDADVLRPWLKPLLDKSFVVSTGERSKAKEYRVGHHTLCDSEYKGQTSLKKMFLWNEEDGLEVLFFCREDV